jgi:hypothetical protein
MTQTFRLYLIGGTFDSCNFHICFRHYFGECDFVKKNVNLPNPLSTHAPSKQTIYKTCIPLEYNFPIVFKHELFWDGIIPELLIYIYSFLRTIALLCRGFHAPGEPESYAGGSISSW